MESTAALDSLCAVRAAVPACWRYRAAALCEAMDALLTTGTAPAPAPRHRRGWGSLYAALTYGRMARQARRDLVIRHALTEGLPL